MCVRACACGEIHISMAFLILLFPLSTLNVGVSVGGDSPPHDQHRAHLFLVFSLSPANTPACHQLIKPPTTEM